MRIVRLSILLAVAAAGCNAEIPITQYPPFWTPQLRAIAVEPFRNESTVAEAGTIVARRVASALAHNGTYRVVPDHSLAEGAPAVATDPPQAALRGVVRAYRAAGYVERRIQPYYYDDYYNHGYYGHGYYGRGSYGGYRTIIFLHNEAEVAVEAELVRLSDGKVLYTTRRPIHTYIVSDGSPPKLTQYGCLAHATDSVVADLVSRLALVRRIVKVKKDETLRTAVGGTGGAWQWEDKFPASVDRMSIVVSLPEVCDRNTFRLTVARTGKDRPILVEEEFTWSLGAPTRSFPLSPRELAAAGGIGKYVITFHADGRKIFDRKFKIEKSSE